MASDIRGGDNPIIPFHWELEFPEVFARENGGFDAITGNPPFLGGKRISGEFGDSYLDWLQNLHNGSHGNADLVAHFFRRAFGLLRLNGTLGLLATNTIGQGDTRSTGLTQILAANGQIYRATRRLKWPGEAAVVVSVLHIVKGHASTLALDSRRVRRISAYLVEGDLDTSPFPLSANSGKAFQGFIVLAMGFTFDDVAAARGVASSLAEMERLVEKDPRNKMRIKPYLGGDEVANHPRHQHSRYVIDFEDMPLRRDGTVGPWFSLSAEKRAVALRTGIVSSDYPEPVAADWPDLLNVVEQKAKPERLKSPNSAVRVFPWWRHWRARPKLSQKISALDSVFATLFTSQQFAVSRLEPNIYFANSLNIFTYSEYSVFSAIQSRGHEVWARFFASTMEDRLRYTPSDCFRSFPFPANFESDPALEAAGEAYHAFRAYVMIQRNEGLTKTYNRFHASGESASDITRLRTLHGEMDVAVLRAYGWNDLADRAVPEFIEQDADEGKTPKTRLDWPAAFKDEVLARLLALNAERAAAERAAGVTVEPEDDDLVDVEGDG
jgi:hypothetical protein